MSSSSPEMGSSSREESKKYKGVRLRKWGKWVSEIRLPNSRERIWLGSYDAPEKAARAFDAASVCLRGSGATGADLNFPNSPPPCRASCSTDPQEVQAAALSHANRAAVTAREAAAALMDVDDSSQATAMLSREAMAHGAGFLDAGSGIEVVAPVRADGSIDWRPVMAHPPPLFSPVGWGSNAYDFLLQAPPADEEDMEESIHGANTPLWSFDLRY
jgi:hypothetical protein